ncbi:MAG TPA: pentapeptide repeat-containing protein [Longimicrobium sp.]|nr:pentapeptide repeat-containing protein [Longimicrobium sp.]
MSILLGFVLPLLFLVALILLWKIPQHQLASYADLSGAERATLMNEYRRTVAQLLGGAFLLFGLYFTWREFQDSRDARIPDRFDHAVLQLADSSITTRLAGIHALERLAVDSKREHDHYAVMGILSSFVRESGITREPGKGSLYLSQDRQLAMWVLGRPPLKLTRFNANLQGADLQGGWFVGVDLTNGYLLQSNLFFANLRGARLRSGTLSEAVLRHANVELTDFTDVCLQNADFRSVRNLDKAIGLRREQLELAILDERGRRIAEELPHGRTGCEERQGG